MGRRPQHLLRIRQIDNDLTSDMTWLTSAEDSSKWDDFISSRLKQPARATTNTTTTTTQPTTHDQTTGTTKTHDQNEHDADGDDDQEDDDTLLIFSQLIDS